MQDGWYPSTNECKQVVDYNVANWVYGGCYYDLPVGGCYRIAVEGNTQG
jgi:hypothetical protein